MFLVPGLEMGSPFNVVSQNVGPVRLLSQPLF